eukprot:XP_001696044.1 predicted protein [Chlamydomonas reinhardtii]
MGQFYSREFDGDPYVDLMRSLPERELVCSAHDHDHEAGADGGCRVCGTACAWDAESEWMERWGEWESRLAYYDKATGPLMDEWYEDVLNAGNLEEDTPPVEDDPPGPEVTGRWAEHDRALHKDKKRMAALMRRWGHPYDADANLGYQIVDPTASMGENVWNMAQVYNSLPPELNPLRTQHLADRGGGNTQAAVEAARSAFDAQVVMEAALLQNLEAAAQDLPKPHRLPPTAGTVACNECGGAAWGYSFFPNTAVMFGLERPFWGDTLARLSKYCTGRYRRDLELLLAHPELRDGALRVPGGWGPEGGLQTYLRGQQEEQARMQRRSWSSGVCRRCVVRGNCLAVEWLLAAGAPLDAGALMAAAAESLDVGLLTWLLSHPRVLAEVFTAAARSGSVSMAVAVMQELLGNGVDVAAQGMEVDAGPGAAPAGAEPAPWLSTHVLCAAAESPARGALAALQWLLATPPVAPPDAAVMAAAASLVLGGCQGRLVLPGVLALTFLCAFYPDTCKCSWDFGVLRWMQSRGATADQRLLALLPPGPQREESGSTTTTSSHGALAPFTAPPTLSSSYSLGEPV